MAPRSPFAKTSRNITYSYEATCSKVETFHRENDKTFRFLVGGVGTGKTQAAVFEIVRHLVGNPKYIGTVGLIVVYKLDHVRLNIIPMIRQVLENQKDPMKGLREGIDYKISLSPLSVDFKFNGSKIIFASSESGSQNLASLNCSIGMLDEADKTSPEVYDEVWARLGRSKAKAAKEFSPPLMVSTMNPVAPSHWLCKRYFGGWLATSKYSLEERNYVGGVMPPSTWMCTLSQYDNPHAKEKWSANEIAYAYSSNVRRRMLYGEFVSSEGTVFGDSFIPDIHVYNPAEYTVPEDAQVYRGLDFGATASGFTAMLWVAIDKETDTVRVFREFKSIGKSPAENFPKMQLPSFDGQRIIKTMSDIYPETFISYRNLGMHITKADKGNGSIEAGIALIMQLFYTNQLRISKDCIGLISDLESYAYNPNTDKPYDKNNNFIDALRYVLWETHGKGAGYTITRASYEKDKDIQTKVVKDPNLRVFAYGPDGEPHYIRLN